MTTQHETTAQEYVDQAMVFLAQSEAEFAQGDTRQGAEKLFGAACQVVIAAARQRGWGYRSHRDNKNTSARLADEYGDQILTAGFIAAERFHIHFYHGDMEDYEIDINRPVADLFVRRMAALIEEYAANGSG